MSLIAGINTVLIANRAEIALRVMSTCRELGIKTVSIFTESEKELPHALLSDQAICLGEGPLSETYLNQERLIEIAKETNADAIHPGYGFLSENASFARAVEKAGLIFIGPTPESIELMGDKIGSKRRLESLSTPLIPGYHGEDQSLPHLLKEAQKIGFPVLIKASAGGGGKGMRIVYQKDEFSEALEAAKREAKNAFGNDKVLIEKFIENPRHIEVQVMSDTHGQHFHFFERECSIQRRYQKIVEESPSPSLSATLRQQICASACEITQSINYRGAGTIEYIYDQKNESFYFLEMNTRLQVEHPVTEMVTGHDLVALQLRVAAGEKLKLIQEEITQSGHAIEVRLYAEDPSQNFLPATGKIEWVGQASDLLKGSRLDSGYKSGNTVTVDFDPMLAKLIVHGTTREMAISKMLLALDDFPFFGVTTNARYLKSILSHRAFKSGETFTHFCETHKDQLLAALEVAECSEEEVAFLLAASELVSTTSTGTTEKNVSRPLAWQHDSGFRNT